MVPMCLYFVTVGKNVSRMPTHNQISRVAENVLNPLGLCSIESLQSNFHLVCVCVLVSYHGSIIISWHVQLAAVELKQNSFICIKAMRA